MDLKTLTLKVVSLVSLRIARHAQTLVALNLDDMRVFDDKFFSVRNLLKSIKPRKSFQVTIDHFVKEEVCAMRTLLYYVDRIKNLHKSRQLLISYVSYKSVSIKTVARWLKEVLENSGIDTSVFKAHSFRGTAASAAFSRGCP